MKNDALFNKNFQLIDIFQSVTEQIKASTSAIVGAGETLAGDFSRFVFAENQANNIDKVLVVERGADVGIFEKTVLQAIGVVKLKSLRGDGITLVVGDAVTVTEAGPYFFEGVLKNINIIEKAQPAVVMLSPANETRIYSETASGLDKVFSDVHLLFTDNSLDFEKATGSYKGRVKGYFSDHYLNEIQRPLDVYVSRFLARLKDNPRFTNGTSSTTVVVEEGTINCQFVQGFGRDNGFPADLTEQISGWVVRMDIRLVGANCLVGA